MESAIIAAEAVRSSSFCYAAHLPSVGLALHLRGRAVACAPPRGACKLVNCSGRTNHRRDSGVDGALLVAAASPSSMLRGPRPLFRHCRLGDLYSYVSCDGHIVWSNDRIE